MQRVDPFPRRWLFVSFLIRAGIVACAFIAFLPALNAKSARENWESLCAQCHGSNGDGKTKEGLKRHIKDWTDPRVQASFSDSGMLKNLMLGVATEGGTERMPRFDSKLSVAEATELLALIRGFKRS